MTRLHAHLTAIARPPAGARFSRRFSVPDAVEAARSAVPSWVWVFRSGLRSGTILSIGHSGSTERAMEAEEHTQFDPELLAADCGELTDSQLRAVYHELRSIAASFFRQQAPEHTLQPTALVNEAVLRLLNAESPSWESRKHFISVAAKAMRHILIDHARRKNADKRGGRQERVTLSGVIRSDVAEAIDAIVLDETLTRLAEVDERQARVVELRFFAGLRVAEVAEVLGISTRTVETDWRMARAWLRRELAERSD